MGGGGGSGKDGKKERKHRHVCTQDSSAKAKMKRHIEIYILADGSTCCQRKKLKYHHDAKHTKPLGAEGVEGAEAGGSGCDVKTKSVQYLWRGKGSGFT